MDILKDLLRYLTDKEARLTGKASLILLTIIGLWVVNNIFGFTYYYNTRNRIEQVGALNAIIANDSTSTSVKQRAQALQMQILTRKNAPEKAIDQAGKLYDQIKYNLAHRSRKPASPVISPTQVPANDDTPQRNDFIFLLSTAGLWIFLALLIAPFIILEGFKQGWAVAIAGFILIEGLLTGIGALYYYGVGIIPIIHNNWGWNYALGSLIQLATIGLIVIASSAKKR